MNMSRVRIPINKKWEEGKYIVYCHICPNGKRYVGFTGMIPSQRFARGNLYQKNKEFYKDIVLYGWDNIEHIALESGLTKEEASEKEIYYIELFNSRNPLFGYNVASGGIHGFFPHTISEETRRKIGISNKGKKRTLEQKQRISEAHKGIKSGSSKTVLQLNKDGEVIKKFSSLREAAQTIGTDDNSIWRCCNKKRKTCKGFKWIYES